MSFLKSVNLNRTPHYQLVIFLWCISFVFLMLGNDAISLTHPDEIFYAQTAKEMLARQSWMTPYIFDEPQFEKPIFFYWLLMISMKFFGTGPFAARFPPAFFGLIGIGIVYWMAWLLFRNKRTAFLAGLVLTTSCMYLALSRAILTDMVFSIWEVVVLAFFYLAYSEPRHKSLGVIASMGFTGIAVLTKGLLGICFPWTAIVAFLWYKKDLKFLKCPASFIGLILFSLLALPWHILMMQRYGDAFIQEYFYNVHLRRLFDAEHQRCNTWYFYPGTMIGGILPWSLYLFPAIYTAYQEIKQSSRNRDQMVFLLFWILGVFIFLQPAQSKLASYIFPAIPALAMLMAYYIDRALENFQNEKNIRSPACRQAGFKVTGYLTGGFFIVVSIAAIVSGNIYNEMISQPALVYAFAGASLICALMIFIFNKSLQYTKMIFINASFTLILLLTLYGGRLYAEPWVSCKNISDVFKKIDHSDSIILASKFFVRGVRYYTDRKMAVIDINGKGFFSPHPIPFLNTDQKVLDLLSSQPVTYGIVKEGNVRDLQRITSGKYKLTHLDNIGGKYIVKI